MGKSYTPKYRIELNNHGLADSFVWERSYGKPTPENIEKWVSGYIRSHFKGGANDHIGKTPNVSSAQIVNQKTQKVVTSWRAPAFWVL